MIQVSKVLGYLKTVRYLDNAFLTICVQRKLCDLCSLDGYSLLETKTSDRYVLHIESVLVDCSQKLSSCCLMP